MSTIFQQDLEPALIKRGYSKNQAHSLSLRCCATFCYHKACSILGLDVPDLEDFVYQVYQVGKPGSHKLGVHHGEMAKFITSLDKTGSVLTLDPLRVHAKLKRFKEIGLYSGDEALSFYNKKLRRLNKDPCIVNTVKQILDYGGVPIVGAIQKLSNGYIGSASKEGEVPTHDFVILSFNKKDNLFTILDPDKRAFEDKDRLRPSEMQPIPSDPTLYEVPPEFLEKNGTKIYHQGTNQERKGGIVIGIFKQKP